MLVVMIDPGSSSGTWSRNSTGELRDDDAFQLNGTQDPKPGYTRPTTQRLGDSAYQPFGQGRST